MSRTRVAALILAAPLVYACAVHDARQSPPSALSEPPSCERVNCAKIAAVNRAAQQRGVTVIWVHPPQKLPASEGDTATP